MSNNIYSDFAKQIANPQISQKLLQTIKQELDILARPIRFMEVCGTHTVAIFQSGLRSILPENLIHLSGPGCPVCVTHDSEVAAFMDLAKTPKVIIATFGDLLRVPDPNGQSLKNAQSCGARVEIVYSPLDALELAYKNPDSEVVFLAVGFETTAPTIAATILMAKAKQVGNFSIFCCHKLVPPALELLLDDTQNGIDAFILPGHVAIILGLKPFEFIAKKYQKNAVVAGFEANDILLALVMMLKQIRSNTAHLSNAYPRAVEENGNPKARILLDEVFCKTDAKFRGLGVIKNSGLELRPEFAEFDALKRFKIELRDTKKIAGCLCGEVLTGKISPPDCPLFGKKCTPQNPTGPCMVSTEGSCAAWYQYKM